MDTGASDARNFNSMPRRFAEAIGKAEEGAEAVRDCHSRSADRRSDLAGSRHRSDHSALAED